MRFDNRLIIDCFANVVNILICENFCAHSDLRLYLRKYKQKFSRKSGSDPIPDGISAYIIANICANLSVRKSFHKYLCKLKRKSKRAQIFAQIKAKIQSEIRLGSYMITAVLIYVVVDKQGHSSFETPLNPSLPGLFWCIRDPGGGYIVPQLNIFG